MITESKKFVELLISERNTVYKRSCSQFQENSSSISLLNNNKLLTKTGIIQYSDALRIFYSIEVE